MQKRPRALLLVDGASSGKVIPALRAWRTAEVSNAAIARLLTQEFGVTVTTETVRRWLLALSEEPNGDEGAAA